MTHLHHLLHVPARRFITWKSIEEELLPAVVDLGADLVPDDGNDIDHRDKLVVGEVLLDLRLREAAVGRTDLVWAVAEFTEVVADGKVVGVFFGGEECAEGAFAAAGGADDEGDLSFGVFVDL